MSAVALVVTALAAPPVRAVCNPPKFVSTYNPATEAFVYWTTNITDPNATVVGRVWSGSTDYTGSCNDGNQTFFYFGIAPGTIGLSLSLGTACVPPGPSCPSGNINARAWVTQNDRNSGFYRDVQTAARQVQETPAGGVNFDFSDVAVHMDGAPRPQVQSEGRNGPVISISTLPEEIPGDSASMATVTSCNFRLAQSPTYPGIDATQYPILLATVPANGGACPSTNLYFVCTAPITQWIVVQVATTAGPDPFVGNALQIDCDPALAEPKTRINPKMTPASVRD